MESFNCRIGFISEDLEAIEPILLELRRTKYDCFLIDPSLAGERLDLADNFDLFFLGPFYQINKVRNTIVLIRCNYGYSIPIIVLTSDSPVTDDIVFALRNGVNHVFSYQTSYKLLHSYIYNAINRTSLELSFIDAEVSYIKFSSKNNVAYIHGNPVSLANQEFKLAVYICKNLGNRVSREQICSNVWGNSIDISSRTIDVHISLLRSKLSLDGKYGLRLRSLYGYGYKLEEI